ncbi:hypothetical protein PG999_014233 [Apiospora kogelbergensis]|uniref:Protein kinase domain-containing protein n=1 Tax=Apiospora kogelbergensis TaxID=1337665 RepID=A0AAW0Q6H3_9PEZI
MDISEVEDRVADVKNYFTNSGMEFRKMIADGNHGGTMLFDKPMADGEMKSLVVKYALETDDDAMSNNDEDLSNEMYWLERLQYAEHIIQIDPEYSSLWDDGQTGPGKLLRRPVIVMEYMQHGTLYTLKKRFRNSGIRVPDRMAWYFMLCLVRACVAMGYRDQFAVVEKTKREKIPRPAEGETKPRPPSTLSQHSMKGLNVLIGGLTPGDPEHGLLPILKLIDFGRGEEIDPKEDPSYGDQIGVSSNLDGVAFIISDLLCDAKVYQGERSVWRIKDNDVYEDRNIRTDADRAVLEDELIDRRLRDTLAFFRASGARQLPPLEDALELCRYGIKNINKSTNPIDSDASIQRLVQNLIFDADFDYLEFEYDFEDTAFTEAENRAIEAEREKQRLEEEKAKAKGPPEDELDEDEIA